MMFFGWTPRPLRLLPAEPGSAPRAAIPRVTVRSEVTRGLNFYAVASLAASATSALPGLLSARGWVTALDDLMLVGIAAFALGWYLRGQNSARRSPVPLALLTLGLVTKIGGVWVAYGWGVAVVGDATAALFLASTTAAVTWRLGDPRRATADRSMRITDDDRLLEALRERACFRGPPKG
jgi:hypothetical protein